MHKMFHCLIKINLMTLVTHRNKYPSSPPPPPFCILFSSLFFSSSSFVMDPIAFFDHLAAKSATSQSSHNKTCSASSIEDDGSHVQQVTLRPSQETPRQDDFQDKWILFVEAYRTEKQGMSKKKQGKKDKINP